MNLHETADNLIAAIGGLYGDRSKFFREGTESPHISEVIADTSVDTAAVTLPAAAVGVYDAGYKAEDGNREHEVSAGWRGMSGVSRYTPLRWAGPEAPTLIYHHGSGESDYTARGRAAVNIIACSIPFNDSIAEYLHAAGRLDRWTFTLAAAVQLTEALVAELRRGGPAPVVCAGISLGGWITNLHHTYFDSCDLYSPIFAGAALDDLFTDSIYRKLTASTARADTGWFTAALNFEADFRARGAQNVYPVMARYDRFIRLSRQAGET